jgi:hypothetical protein
MIALRGAPTVRLYVCFHETRLGRLSDLLYLSTFLASNPGAGARGHARPGHGHGYGLRCYTFEFVSIS